MAADAALLRILDRHAAAARTTRERVLAMLDRLWRGLPDYHDPQAATFAKQATPIIHGGQRAIASITASQLAATARAVTGSSRAAGVGAVTNLRGVPTGEVYRRPFQTVWYQLSIGAAVDVAIRLGGERLSVIAQTDLQLARTNAARDVLSNDERVIGYQRVTSGAGCDLCEAAAADRYNTGDLMPIHDRCTCDVEPIFGGGAGTVEQPTGSADVAVEEHGELGPVLVSPDHNFRSADDL